MKKIMILTVFLSLLGVPTTLAMAETPPPTNASCDITLSFGSYAMGIDHEVKAKITAYVEKSKDITGHRLTPWGREGEKNLCLSVKPETFEKVYKDLKAMIPEKSAKAWTEIRAKGKPNFRTQWPKK